MAGRIPQEFIDELIARVDIVDVIDSRVPLRKTGKEYQACCPFHQEKTPSFTVSQQKQFYHCFGCGAHGTALGFLMEYEHLPFREAVEELANRAGLQVPVDAGKHESKPRPSQDLYAFLEKVVQFYRHQLKSHPNHETAVSYLKRRGLSGEIALEFELGFAPPGWHALTEFLGDQPDIVGKLLATGMLIAKDDGKTYDRFRDRVMFPIRDRRGRVIGFGGRVLDDGTPKYLNSPETELFHKGNELYGLYQARKSVRDFEQILVVEGYMDVVSLAQHGVRYAVATLGTAVTEQHLNELVRHCDKIVFCFDGDRAGRQAAWRAVETAFPLIRDGLQLRFMFLPDGEDPDSLIKQVGKVEFERKIGDALPFSEFFFETILSQADTRGLDGQAKLLELAKPYMAKLQPGTFKDLMTGRLAELARISPRSLGQQAPEKTQQGRLEGGKKPATLSRKQMEAPSLVRKAITLLMHKPSLASTVEDGQMIKEADLSGVNLLSELIEFLHDRPHLTTASVLEHWRDSPHARHLVQLASRGIDLPEEGYEAEFKGTIDRLKKQGLKDVLERLLQKSQYSSLTPEEKRQLSFLLKENA